MHYCSPGMDLVSLPSSDEALHEYIWSRIAVSMLVNRRREMTSARRVGKKKEIRGFRLLGPLPRHAGTYYVLYYTYYK